jgi:hypothetical protein
MELELESRRHFRPRQDDTIKCFRLKDTPSDCLDRGASSEKTSRTNARGKVGGKSSFTLSYSLSFFKFSILNCFSPGEMDGVYFK